MKGYLNDFITDANLTNEAGSTIKKLIMYAEPLEELRATLLDEGVDGIFAVGVPIVEPKMDHDQTPYRYVFHVPVSVWCITKYDGAGNITIQGTNLKWKMENELRRVVQENPIGSQYAVERVRNTDVRLGGEVLYGNEVTISFTRSPTA